jgi:hypothetical protein
MSQIDELRKSIDARIVQANNEIAALQAARAALSNGNAATASAVAATIARPSRRGKPRTAASNGSSAESSTGAGTSAATGSETATSTTAGPRVAATKASARQRTSAQQAASNAPSVEAPTVDGAALDGGTKTASKRSPATQTRTPVSRKPAKSRRRVEVLLAGKLEAMLGDSEAGLSAVTISTRANAARRQVLDLLRELEQTGRVRRSVTGRTGLWRLVTDEERIAERAAELERLSVGTSRK